MAAVVARDSSQASTSTPIQEKVSRNKRKFRADQPLGDLDHVPDQPPFVSYELAPMVRVPFSADPEHHFSVCDGCKTLAFTSRELVASEEFQNIDWGDTTESELEELVLSNLDIIFRSAIKTITTYGYNEDVAANAVLRSCACFGCQDIVSKLVDHALAYLGSGQPVETSRRENLSEDFLKLEKSVLEEMVGVLREVRPFFNRGGAMWYLLMCDMNICHACVVDGDSLGTPAGPSQTYSGSRHAASLAMLMPSDSSNRMASTLQPELHTVVGIPNLPSGRFSAGGVHSNTSTFHAQKESSLSSSNQAIEYSSVSKPQSFVSGIKTTVTRKSHGSTTKREIILRQKNIHFEKGYRAHGSRSGLRSAKISGVNGLIQDRKSKLHPDSSQAVLKNGLRTNKSVGNCKILADTTLNLSFSTGPTSTSGATDSLSPFHPNTELSLSLPSSTIPANPGFYSIVSETSGANNLIPSNNSSHGTLQDVKDEVKLKLLARVRELQTEMQLWKEWAHQKVMQVARRLSKEKSELQTLRQEKEEVTRLKKDKQALEENTMKKLHEMENALSKASGQVKRANAATLKLKVENAELRQEMEAAKVQAEESAASCQVVSTREMETQKKFRSWEKQKANFQEELAAEKRKLFHLQQQLNQAKELFDQIEGKRRREKKVKEDFLAQADLHRKERVRIEASAKLKENSIRSKAELDLQRYKYDIKMLEHQIAKLRLTTDSSKITALQWGLDNKARSMLELHTSDLGAADVHRDRECVMCLTEEMSVVFLPCAHQVVCMECNTLHQKQGMTECPSCRTPIDQRISVRSADA